VTHVNGTTNDREEETIEKVTRDVPRFAVRLYLSPNCTPADPVYTLDTYPRAGGIVTLFETHNESLAHYYVDSYWPQDRNTSAERNRPRDFWWHDKSKSVGVDLIDSWELVINTHLLWYLPPFSVWLFGSAFMVLFLDYGPLGFATRILFTPHVFAMPG